MTSYPAPVRALQHRDFRLFASGQMVSLIGTWMQMVAQSWLIYRLTGSATALGLATFFGQLPLLVLAPFGGLVADRIETKRLLLVTQVAAMLLAAALGTLTLAMRKHSHGLSSCVAAASLLFGGSLVAFAFSRSLLLSALLLVPVGYGFMVQMAATNTLIQMMVPDAFRGRIMSIYTVMFLGMAPLGGLLVGGLSRFLSPGATVAVAGAGCVLGGLAFILGLPTWRLGARELLAAKGSQT